jgi:alpha-tubulin suppressor-like RCC1 family protein
MRRALTFVVVGLAAWALHCGSRSQLLAADDGLGGDDGQGGNGNHRDGGPGSDEAGADAARDTGADADTVRLGNTLVPNVPQMAAGESHACLRTKKGEVFCWGTNQYGQLGDGTTDLSFLPKKVPGLPKIVSVVSGLAHVCALAEDQSVWCWGDNTHGALGDGNRSLVPVTKPVRADVAPPVSIYAGGWTSCALDDHGDVRCWGRNTNGQCASTVADHILQPAIVRNLGHVSAMAMGYNHSCVVVDGGAVKCWGRNSSGELGEGFSGAFEPAPVDVLHVTGAHALGAGDDHVCAIVDTGGMVCWGDGGLGELGDGRAQGSESEVQVAGMGDAVQVAGGLEHTCAVLRGGTVQCWGKGIEGQLGVGGTPFIGERPATVLDITDAVSVAAGYAFSCAAHKEHGAMCWGASAAGSLGHGDGDPEFVGEPVEVIGLE